MRERPRGKVVIYIMARPLKFDVNDIIASFDKYITDTEQPLVKEFCLQYGIAHDTLHEYADSSKELSSMIKKAIDKQEVAIIRLASQNKLNPGFCIFRLKQPVFGYTDKQEIAVDAKVVTFEGNDKLPK